MKQARLSSSPNLSIGISVAKGIDFDGSISKFTAVELEGSYSKTHVRNLLCATSLIII